MPSLLRHLGGRAEEVFFFGKMPEWTWDARTLGMEKSTLDHMKSAVDLARLKSAFDLERMRKEAELTAYTTHTYIHTYIHTCIPI